MKNSTKSPLLDALRAMPRGGFPDFIVSAIGKSKGRKRTKITVWSRGKKVGMLRVKNRDAKAFVSALCTIADRDGR